MLKKFLTRIILISTVLSVIGCGGLRYSQLDPAAKDYHPKRIAVFTADVGTFEEARQPIEQIVPGVLMDKKWFSDVTDTASLNRQMNSNPELNKTMVDYLAKLNTVNYSDAALSKKIGELTKTDAFLLVAVDFWNYTVEKDKLAKVSIGLKLIDAETGKIMWKAGHQLKKTYTFFKPELADVARSVVSDMVNEMPH
ncbi:MAG: hypothetical protein CVU71_11565 [Deltaproteobacteria bacterium HGW-Deltaproteobacteria-6]|nr:MAG: hypothetical protein CVU71_11565 [Deltaproteobacteria bacterium HGW-Deltaproteobacteria-6]